MVIPPGALAEDTLIVVRPVSVPTALPVLGEQCGQSFEVDGGGASLSAPIEITLPVDPTIVDLYGQVADDVRVWALDGEEWESLDPLGTDEGSVTFEVDRFTAAAAGVRRLTFPICVPSTTLGCGTTTPTPGPACAGPAFCTTVLSPGPVPESGVRMVTDGTNLFYTTRPATNQVAVVRRTLTGSSSTTPAFTTPSTTRRNLAVVDNPSEMWLGIGIGGNVRFVFGGAAPTAFDTDSEGFGAAVFRDGMLRLSRAGFSTRFDGSANFEPRAIPTNMGQRQIEEINLAASDPDFNFRTVVLTYQFLSTVDELNPNPGNTTLNFSNPFPTGRANGRPGLGRTAAGDSIMAFPHTTNTELVINTTGTLRAIGGIPRGLDAVVDDAGNVWIGSNGSPEVIFVEDVDDDANRSVQVIPLTTAAVGTTEYQDHLVRSLAKLDDGRVAVHLLNNEILLLRRPGT